MSYILDALRRADAERERGAVPGLYAQQASTSDDDHDAPARRSVWPWLASAVAAIAVAFVAWRVVSDTSLPTQAVPPAPAAVVASSQASMAAPAPAPEPSTAPPAVAAATPQRPAVARAEPPSTSPPKATGVLSAATPAPTVRATHPSATHAAGELPMASLPMVADLPEDIRRQMPPVVVGGSIYSPDAASRLLILNGILYHEKDVVAPQLVLEQIGLKTAVMSFRGIRYRISY